LANLRSESAKAWAIKAPIAHVNANAESVKQANQITELRADDIGLFRAVVTWGAAPLYLLGLGLIIVLSYKTGSLGPIWFVAIAYLPGALTTFQAQRMRDDWRPGAARRAFRKQQKER
jgi:hypothetical protein